MGEAHLHEQIGEGVGIGAGEFDEFEAVEAHRIGDVGHARIPWWFQMKLYAMIGTGSKPVRRPSPPALCRGPGFSRTTPVDFRALDAATSRHGGGRGTRDRPELDDFLPYRLSIVSNAVSDAIASTYQALFGLRIPEWRLIAVIAETDGLTPQALALATRMDKVTVSRAAAALAKRALVERRPHPADPAIASPVADAGRPRALRSGRPKGDRDGGAPVQRVDHRRPRAISRPDRPDRSRGGWSGGLKSLPPLA